MIDRQLNGISPRTDGEERRPTRCPDLRAMETVFGPMTGCPADYTPDASAGDPESAPAPAARAVSYDDSLAQWDAVREAARDWLAADPPGMDRIPENRLLDALGLDSAPLTVPILAPRRSRRPVLSRRASGLAFGAAFACAMALLFLPGDPAPTSPPQTVGSLAGIFGTVRLNGSGRSADADPADLRAGSVVASSRKAGCALSLGIGVTSFLNEETEIEIASADRVRLRRGEVWFRVRPGAGGLTVETPRGEVKVLGTAFGVRVGPDSVRVEVSEGRVMVSPPAHAARTLAAAEALSVTAAGAGAVFSRIEGSAEPRWVREAAALGASGCDEPSLLPSLAGLQ